MDTKEILQRTLKFKPRIDIFYTRRYFKASTAETKELGQLAKEIYPKFNLDLTKGCNTCVGEAIRLVSNFYDREIKNYPEVLDPPPTEQTTSTETSDTPPKRKSRKSNKIYSEDVTQTT